MPINPQAFHSFFNHLGKTIKLLFYYVLLQLYDLLHVVPHLTDDLINIDGSIGWAHFN